MGRHYFRSRLTRLAARGAVRATSNLPLRLAFVLRLADGAAIRTRRQSLTVIPGDGTWQRVNTLLLYERERKRWRFDALWDYWDRPWNRAWQRA